MIVISPIYNEKNALELAKHLDTSYTPIHTKVFPNKEILARIEDPDKIRNNKIILYFPTYPDTNNRLILLFQTLEILGTYNANKISLLIPYLSYSRQDKRFLEGEALSLKLFLEILEYLGVDTLYTIDIHSKEALQKYCKIRYKIISLSKELVKTIKRGIVGKDEFILVAPDEGRLETIKKLAKHFQVDYISFKKIRDLHTGKITIKPPNTINKLKNPIILDDEISTGGTISKVAKILKEKGSENIIAAAIHLILIDKAIERLYNSGVTHIVGTNTIPNPFTILNIEEYVAKEILKMEK
jgi:ribose-phosphate pyrophosphokinase